MKAVDYILKLTETPGGNDKKVILREAAVNGVSELFKGFQLAYDKRKIFGVKKVPLIEGDFTEDELNEESEFGWDEFEELIYKLETRQLTGNAARDALHKAAEVANINEWNKFYRPILMKDMRCGVTDTTVNKILKEVGGKALDFIIPVWKVMLAEDSKKHPGKMKGQKALDPKLDGVRLTTIIDVQKKTVQMFTRNGKINTNFSNIVGYLEQIITTLPVSIVLEGEIVSDNFQALMTQINRKDNIDTSDAHYALFDVLALADFEMGKSGDKQMVRHKFLVSMQENLQRISKGKIYVLPKLLVDLDTPEGLASMNEFYQETVAAGYEGIMVKDVNAIYECKRSRAWLKWKPIESIDLIIVDSEEGTKRNEGKHGAFVCEGTEDGKFIKVNVGSGYSDNQREEFWQNRDKLKGEMIEIEYDAITKSKNSDHYSLRFPRFKRFRSINKDGKI